MEPVEMGSEITMPANVRTPNISRGHVSIGVDVGKVADPTAIVVAEQFLADPDQMQTAYEVRTIRRLALGTPYPEVCSTIVGVVDGLVRLRGSSEAPWLVIDGTGVGEPVSDEIRGALRGRNVRITTAIFVAGERFKGRRTDARVAVGKDWMVARLQVLLENRRLKLPENEMAHELARELQDFEVRTIDGHDVSGAFRTGTHDDLVVALGLACLDAPVSVYERRSLQTV